METSATEMFSVRCVRQDNLFGGKLDKYDMEAVTRLVCSVLQSPFITVFNKVTLVEGHLIVQVLLTRFDNSDLC